MNKARVESFSDGVFAFAITLLVLSVPIPDIKSVNDQLLSAALLHTIPQLLPYVTSFATIGIVWLNHHSMFHEVEQVKHTTLTLNLLLLLVVAFIPYPTGVIGKYGALPSAVALYGATFTACGMAFSALWFDIRRNRLSRECENDTHIRSITVRNLIGPVIYPAATALAFIAPKTSLGIFFGLAAFYFLPGLQSPSVGILNTMSDISMEITTNPAVASDLKQALGELLHESAALYALVPSAPTASRMQRSVMRPLKDALHKLNGPETRLAETVAPESAPAPIDHATIDEKLFALAKQAAALRLRADAPPELLEAFAALLNLHSASALSDISSQIAGLSNLDSEVRVALDGPYLVTNIQHFTNWLGEELPLAPQMALCRCGQSSIKPYCDGTHAETGFSGVKDPNRVPDHRDDYKGQVEIFDNRGICAHSGFCTDRLASVFHVRQEPFITPSGGRMDEIIHAVRACPSGALSYAIDGVEARGQVDQDRPPSIEVSKDGPYRITGGIRLVDQTGSDVPRAEGSSREHFSLCRCGHSQNKPFCSGMHWSIQFKDPVADASREPTLFEWAGGFPALLRMTRIFYTKYVPQDSLVGPLFASMSPDHPERVAAWFSEVFGGPDFYSQRYGGYSRMISQHVGKCITEEQRARWVQMLCQSANDAMLPNDPEFRAAFVAYLEWGSRIGKENSQQHAAPPPNMPVPRWWWVCNAKPGTRISALAANSEADHVTINLPGPGETPGFERHIKSMFRPMDRGSMRFAFDLWSHDDVAKHAPAILQRLQAGTMPCDGAWPPTQIAVFEQWVAAGTPE